MHDKAAEERKLLKSDRRVIILKVEGNYEPFLGISKAYDILYYMLTKCDSDNEIIMTEKIRDYICKKCNVTRHTIYRNLNKLIEKKIVVKRNKFTYYINSSRVVYVPDKHYKYDDKYTEDYLEVQND